MPPTAKDLQRVLDAAGDTLYGALLLTAVLTGLRLGELLGLRWQDVDFEARLLHVQQSAQWLPGRGYIFRPPKTARSRRTVDISPALVVCLRAHRQAQLEARLAIGLVYDDHDLVFASPTGKPVDPSNLRRSWQRILSHPSVSHFRFHELRHAHASLMLQEGVHVKVISDRLGHSGIGITMDTYGHLVPGLQADAAARLDHLFDRPAVND